MPKCIHENSIQRYSILSTVKRPPFDKEGKLYYYINNHTSQLSKIHQESEIEEGFDAWNYHLIEYNLSFERTMFKEQAYLNIWFVGGNTGKIPDPPHEDILNDKDLLAYYTGSSIYISDLVDWKSGEYSLRLAVEHEIGHAQGIGHTHYRRDTMYAAYIAGNQITYDTKKAMEYIYGKNMANKIFFYLQLFFIVLIAYLILKYV